MKVLSETLQIEMPEYSEDYPDQNAERRVEVLQRALVNFVETIARDHTVSWLEDQVLRFGVGMKLLGPFLGKLQCELLAERLHNRLALCTRCSHPVIDHGGPGGCSHCSCKAEV